MSCSQLKLLVPLSSEAPPKRIPKRPGIAVIGERSSGSGSILAIEKKVEARRIEKP